MKRKLKKPIIFFMCLMLFVITITTAVGCNKVRIQSLELGGMQTEFDYGEDFTSDGLIVTANYSDGTHTEVDIDNYIVDYSTYNKNTAGDYTIKVKIKNTEISKNYTVKVHKESELWNYDEALKVLCIGNSFSADMVEYGCQIANSIGVKHAYICNMYIGGCTLSLHASNARNNAAAYTYFINDNGKQTIEDNYRIKDALLSQDWDFVTLQQTSGDSGFASTYSELDYLAEYVKNNLPKDNHTKLIWCMNWAYQSNSTYEEFSKYQHSQAKMYEMITSTVKSIIVPNTAFAGIIPNGTAIQNARTSFYGDDFTRDGYHLSYDIGRYIAGLTMIHKLTKLPIRDVSFAPDNVVDAVKQMAIESAENAVKTPFEVTASEFKEFPAPPESDYRLLNIDMVQGFWDSTDANYYKVLQKNDGNSEKYFGTKRFTRQEIPVGSIIILKGGWQYRPEGWVEDERQPSRPSNVTSLSVEVTEEWWGDYTLRAFNISKAGTPVIKGLSAEAKAAFKIYVPKTV